MRKDFTVQHHHSSSAFQQMQANSNKITTTHNHSSEGKWQEAIKSVVDESYVFKKKTVRKKFN
jgi:hypothetical protein